MDELLSEQLRYAKITIEERAKKSDRWNRLKAFIDSEGDRATFEAFLTWHDDTKELFMETVLSQIGIREWFAFAVGCSGEDGDTWTDAIEGMLEQD